MEDSSTLFLNFFGFLSGKVMGNGLNGEKFFFYMDMSRGEGKIKTFFKKLDGGRVHFE
jgi:hypothetical protein